MVGAITGVALAGIAAVPALAAKPSNPGCFGTDRAAVLHTMQDGTWTYTTAAPGASEWGAIAGQRAGDNGSTNRDYICQP